MLVPSKLRAEESRVAMSLGKNRNGFLQDRGGGGSLGRTGLRRQFPELQGKCREILVFNPAGEVERPKN